MLGLSYGELFVVVFLTVSVLAAPWVMKIGAAIGRRFDKTAGESRRERS